MCFLKKTLKQNPLEQNPLVHKDANGETHLLLSDKCAILLYHTHAGIIHCY